MRCFSKAQIVASLDPEVALRCLEQGFIAFSAGKVQVPPVQGFSFPGANGDCCVKSAYVEGSATFTVKISTGFYDNPGKDLPSNDGLMLVLSAHTGQPLALLQDEGWLTGMRTALAGRIAARLLAPPQVTAIGMLGTGMQARMQLEQLGAITDCRQVVVWGRQDSGLAAYRAFARAQGYDVRTTQDAAEVAGAANLIVCTTPSRQPLLRSEWVRPGTHITAVGADGPGKQELDPALVARAARIVVDSVAQCSQYGEVAHALRSGQIDTTQLIELGTLLASGAPGREHADQITLADLTGVAVQDAQISSCALAAMSA
ncbi:ornithine cyclodeaminase family protein [Pseudomonas sp. BCRC 81390]|uniref:ornithine cyclodeaminase family protein n=1 Tax=Pseudomonas sp. BCRC 81390 TaxID=3054778 RepID=UPI00259A9C08|nr:ornithine cyclodeaminase family protein [Pseudomonas sp. BCRC 81390]MDM3888717.1 ornithine cyclodeaminase family protein [Pseudomonas sp. BCRC 81390]